VSLFSAALTLFLVMDPLGNVPLFVSFLQSVPAKRRPWVIFRENLLALFILVFFLFGGPGLMRVLHIEPHTLSIAGGLVLLLIALEMIFHHFGGVVGGTYSDTEPLIVPLAVPLIAGPSSMTVLMLLSTQHPGQMGNWAAALIAAWAAGLLILMMAGRLQGLLGPRGLAATERLMGMVLVVVAVQMGLSGITEFVQRMH
jgi:multiple antibiotic resistance protein